jgi:hypothetical protein
VKNAAAMELERLGNGGRALCAIVRCEREWLGRARGSGEGWEGAQVRFYLGSRV